VVDGDELDGSELEWGTVFGGVGFGMRWHLRPYNFENDFRLQAIYELGYFYNDRASETDPSVDLPPDTPIHQLHFKMRGDAFERNLFEMIHRGYAMGGDLVFGHRQRWSDSGAEVIDNVVFRRNDRNQTYLRLSGYLALATGLPYLSERHTFLTFTHAGWTPNGNVDRFNAFRRGGGPPNTQESEDLARHPFPGAFIEAVPMERYVFVTMEYRLEVFFFLYLHLRTTFARARIPEIKGNGEIRFDDETSWASSVGITTGLPIIDAQAYVEYAYTTDDFQRDDDGHGFLLVISKSF